MAESNNAMLMVALSWITLTTARQMTINEANPPCEAPLVWEGQTGKLKFFYRPEAFSSEAFFAILKRADNPGKDIIVCTTRLGIKCNVSSPQYNLHSVTNHSLTVLIPRITKDFEDTYLLLTYTKGTLPPTDACRLVVKANKETCDNPAVFEGQIGKLTFFLRPDILAFEDFFATLRRADNPGRDILVCTRKSPIHCHIDSPHLYQSNGIVDDTLTLLIPNVSRTFEDTYVLKVYANGSSQQFDACSLHVKDTVTGDENVSKGWIPALIVCLCLLLMIGIGLLVWKRNPKCLQKCMRRLPFKANRNHDEPGTPRPQDQGQQQSLMGTTPQHVPPPKPGNTSSLSDK
ncbi:uncharacterized protein [Littorina saxatilis]|uniref:Uncharacterized protein n=1 Tax=Littorina saxatilis TaxID=31220 RepID=A0AAN9AN54_9CAEN